VVLVRAGERWLGVFAEEVACVERGRAATPLPRAPVAVLGVVSVRGRVLTLLDPLALLKERRADAADAAFNTAPAFVLALRGDEQLALAVDSAERIADISADEIEPPAADEAHVADGTFQDNGVAVVLLDINRLWASAVAGVERRRRRRTGSLPDEG
jgi:purine-binding chemotaxis protein CheW